MIFYRKIEKGSRLIHLSILNVLAIFAGISAFNLLAGSGYIKIGRPHRIMEYEYFSESLNLLTDQMKIYFLDWNYKSLILIISGIVFLHHIAYSLIKTFNRAKFNMIDTYITLSVLVVVIVFFAPVLNGNYTGFDTLRYNIYVFYLLIINAGILIFLFFQRLNFHSLIMLKSVIVILLFLASVNIIILFKPDGLKNYLSYYPEKVQLVDELSKKSTLKCGLGNYWNSKVITMFSKNNVRIYSVNNTIDPYPHVTNENWFMTDNFNFFLLDPSINDTIINKIFNNNTDTVTSGEVKLLITPVFRFNKDYKIINIEEN